MFKNVFACSLLTAASFLSSREVDVAVQLQVGNRVGETEIRISSKKYTQLSMDGESLGFAMRLVSEEEQEEEENERFETFPTNNEILIANFFRTGKQMRIGAGANINGYRFEKELVVTILGIKKIS